MTVRIFVSIAVLSLLVSCDSTEKGMTLNAILDRHTEARGGRAAIENIESMWVELKIGESGVTYHGNYIATRDGWMRIDVSVDGVRVFSEALGPGGGWQMFSDGRIEGLTPAGEAALKRGIVGNLYGLHELRDLGYSLELLGATLLDGTKLWEFEKVAPDGTSEHIFVRQDTYLVDRETETSALHPDVDATKQPQETVFLHYRETGGVMYADRSETRNLESGDILQTDVVKSRKVNERVDQAIFERPGEAE